MSISLRVARHIAGLEFETLPAGTVRAAKHVLLDALGTMLGASGVVPEVTPFVDLARASGTGSSRILGTNYRTSAVQAAFANGAMAHALDFEDAFDPAPGHPNASLVPALIALAQAERGIDGRTFLTALAAGGDLSCRVALALERRMEEGGWYPPPITAGVGAAAGCARLLGLDSTGVLDALSLALCQLAMPGEIMHSRRTVIRAVREAFPAQNAVQSVLLAQSGVAGFEAPLEGRGGFYALFAASRFSEDVLLDRLGEHFWIEHLTFKPWPSCRGTHPFIELALSMRGEGLAPRAIARIDIQADSIQRMLVEPIDRKRAPDVVIDAKFSIPFTVAVAFEKGRVSLDEFSEGALRDPKILELAGKVSARIVDAPTWTKGSGGSMRVTLADGRVHEAHIETARGCPANPLSESELREKFMACASKARHPMSDGDAANLADAILTLEDRADVGALLA